MPEYSWQLPTLNPSSGRLPFSMLQLDVLPFGTMVYVRRRTWNQRGQRWAARGLTALVLSPSVEVTRQHVVVLSTKELMVTSTLVSAVADAPAHPAPAVATDVARLQRHRPPGSGAASSGVPPMPPRRRRLPSKGPAIRPSVASVVPCSLPGHAASSGLPTLAGQGGDRPIENVGSISKKWQKGQEEELMSMVRESSGCFQR